MSWVCAVHQNLGFVSGARRGTLLREPVVNHNGQWLVIRTVAQLHPKRKGVLRSKRFVVKQHLATSRKMREVVSKRQIAFESKAQADEKAQHTREYVSILKRSATQLSDARWRFATTSKPRRPPPKNAMWSRHNLPFRSTRVCVEMISGHCVFGGPGLRQRGR
jgi:hypothetical protein